jgi:hypothetical protein
MTAINLSFDPSGTGTCFFTEAIDLHRIGTLEITRASTIEFNAHSQAWEVRNLDNQVLYSNPSRQLCLEWEQHHHNQ